MDFFNIIRIKKKTTSKNLNRGLAIVELSNLAMYAAVFIHNFNEEFSGILRT